MGLAIARKLQQRDGVSTVLIEKHGAVGTETSSRNSEVGTVNHGPVTSHSHLHSNTSSLEMSMAKRQSRSSTPASTTAPTASKPASASAAKT